MHAPPKNSEIPVVTPKTLEQYDAFLFGIPTRYGNFPGQWKAFWDACGQQWQSGAYWGKYAGLFVSTASQGGGQESTCLATMSTLAHHGIIYVPLGYKTVFGTLADLSEVRGGSPWGAGTFAVSPSSCLPPLFSSDIQDHFVLISSFTGRRRLPPADSQGDWPRRGAGQGLFLRRQQG